MYYLHNTEGYLLSSSSYQRSSGDVGYDSANGFASSIPMDGAPFGSTSDLFEDTIAGGGTAGFAGSQKHVRNNGGTLTNGIRTGGAWWIS